MKTTTIWLCTLISAAAFLSGSFATAQVQGCVSTRTLDITCQGPGGCDHEFQIDICMQGCAGACNCGYGLCCGNNYTSCNASGSCYTCTSFRKKAEQSSLGASPTIQKNKSRGASREEEYLISQLIFAPDRCRHSYGVIVADDFRE